IDFPDIEQRRLRLLGLAVDGERPDQLFLPVPVLRDVDLEQKVVLARVEDRRLPAVGGAGIEAILRADGNDWLLDVVPVQVPEDHVEAAVRYALPAFIDRDDRLSRLEPDVKLCRLRLSNEWSGREREQDDDPRGMR